MALGINTIWHTRSGATGSNVNGAGFNPESANLTLNDLTTDTNTGNTASPIVSSATYTFVAGDQFAWLFIQSGTSWNAGWYQIASVSGGKATLSGAIGSAVLYTSGATRSFALNTTAGCASVGTPTGGVFTIDYSQQDGTGFALTGLTSAGAGNVLLTVTTSPTMVGNIGKSVSGTNVTVGWFEVTAISLGVSITFTTNQAGTAISTGVVANGVVNIGGSASLQSSAAATDDLFFENGAGTNGSGAHIFFIRKGTYSGSNGALAMTANGGTQAPIRVVGYNSIITDGLTGNNLATNRPTIVMAANAVQFKSKWIVSNIIYTGTATNVFDINGGKAIFLKVTNTSTNAGRNSFTSAASNYLFYGCEAASYRGQGISSITNVVGMIFGCYLHDSDAGLSCASTNVVPAVINNIIACNTTCAIRLGAALTTPLPIVGNTLYGFETPTGVGVSCITGNTDIILINNQISGFVTGVALADTQSYVITRYNNFFNNTSNITNGVLNGTDTTINPSFTNVVERAGLTATTTSGNHLVQTGATFQTWGVAVGDYLLVFSGTPGPTVPAIYTIASVDSETQITTNETLTANATADHVWRIIQGRDFSIGSALKATAYPGIFPGSLTTGYLDVGAVQRQEPSASGDVIVNRVTNVFVDQY